MEVIEVPIFAKCKVVKYISVGAFLMSPAADTIQLHIFVSFLRCRQSHVVAIGDYKL
jgi:hypothetical protein